MVLRYGDIFSGISCPMFAIKQLGLEYKYEFACEINKKCRQFLQENHSPNIIYPDATKLPDELPKLDLFVAGFPCQPFSVVNRSEKKGSTHHAVNYFEYCLEVIKKTNTECFILENVVGLTYKSNQQFYDNVINSLNQLKEYSWESKIMNSMDYGSTHFRNRIWFVGTRKKDKIIQFPSPSPMPNPILQLDLNLPYEVAPDIAYKEVYPITEEGIYITKIQFGLKQKHLTKTNQHYCFLTSAPKFNLMKVDKDNSRYVRKFSNKECCRIFGLLEPIINLEKYNMFSLLGNGMDINLLMKLILCM